MTDTWDGRPQNPKERGLHLLRDDDGNLFVGRWMRAPQEWMDHGPPEHVARHYTYLGPLFTLAEVEARVAAARREGIEAAAEAAQKHALSEGWSNTSALRFRNCIRALLAEGG